ncbi:MAG: hypothetical protein ACKPA7_16420, partial [Sphaerospermopsis kisseleviana]
PLTFVTPVTPAIDCTSVLLGDAIKNCELVVLGGHKIAKIVDSSSVESPTILLREFKELRDVAG